MSTTPTTNTSRSSSAASSSSPKSSSYRDDSSEIDELDHRSRRLTSILRKNVDKAERRKSVLDVVRNKAWLLEDQVKLLDKQTATVGRSLARQSCRRRVIVFLAVALSLFLIINKTIFSGLYNIVEHFLQRLFATPPNDPQYHNININNRRA